MRTTAVIRVLSAAALCLLSTHCAAGESREDGRALSLIGQGDAVETDAVSIVRKQRELFAILTEHGNTDTLTAYWFAIRDGRRRSRDGAPPDSAEWRYSQTLYALNARPQLDWSLIAEVGNLSAYEHFEAHPLGASQIMVIARRAQSPAILTDWIRSGSGWKAIEMILYPSDATIAGIRERRFRRAVR